MDQQDGKPDRAESPGGWTPDPDIERFNYNDEYRRHYRPGSRAARQFWFTMYVVLVSRRWRARVTERLRSIGQTTARWEALFAVAYADGEITQNRLAKRMAIEGPTLVRMLHNLEADGLVRRVNSAHHRRAKVITLTDKGQTVVGEIDDMTRELRDVFLSGLSDEEIESSVALMRKLYLRFEEAWRETE